MSHQQPKGITFLHTSPLHVATFEELVTELAPGTPTVPIVKEALLAEARAGDYGSGCRASYRCH